MATAYRLKDGTTGFDTSIVSGAAIPKGDTTGFMSSGPDSGGLDPFNSWAGIADIINQRLRADYGVSTEDETTIFANGISDEFGPMAIPDIPRDALVNPDAMQLQRKDILRIRDTLRGINAAITLPRIRRIWDKRTVEDLLLQRWAKLGPVEETFDVEVAPAFVDAWLYIIDMDDGLGPRAYYLPAIIFPIPGAQLLARWAAEDTFEGDPVVVRGKVLLEGRTKLAEKYKPPAKWKAGTYTVVNGRGESTTVSCQYPEERREKDDNTDDNKDDDNTDNNEVGDFFVHFIGDIVTTVQYFIWSPTGDVAVNSSEPGRVGYIVNTAPSGTETVRRFGSRAEAEAELAAAQNPQSFDGDGNPVPGNNIGIVGSGSGRASGSSYIQKGS